jgi:hypothetical protein
MSFRIINGRQIEVLDEPDFFEPKPVSPKRNNILFADNSGNIHIKIEEKTNNDIPSILGKRKLQDAFGVGTHDKERYGQEIQPDFFVNNVGHGVYPNPKGSQDRMTQGTAFAIPTTNYDEDEIIDWCYKYLASKKT